MITPKLTVILGLVALLVPLACAPTASDRSDATAPPEDAPLSADEIDELIRRAAVALDAGEPDTAYDAYATAVVSGADLTSLFYALLHDDDRDDPHAALHHYVGISRVLLERRPDLDPTRRSRADAFLCDESLGLPLDECSPEAVEARLDTLEASLSDPSTG